MPHIERKRQVPDTVMRQRPYVGGSCMRPSCCNGLKCYMEYFYDTARVRFPKEMHDCIWRRA